MSIKAFLFDLDGTIIDSEKYYRKCWYEALNHFGFKMSFDEAIIMRSFGKPFVIDYLHKRFGETCDYFEVRKYRDELMKKYIEGDYIGLKDGVIDALNYLKNKNVIVAMVTASEIKKTEKFLKKLDIYDYFSNIITTEKVEKGKPAPDVYIYACKELGLDPTDCVAIEDSPNGVASAYGAGVRVIMVPDQTEPDIETSKKLFKKFDRIDEIKKLPL